MSLDAETFKINRPEFAAVDDPVVEAAITKATQLCPASRWGALRDQGIELRTAKALALSPFARNMALVSKDGSTVYDDELMMLIRSVAAGGVVI